jgi:hypothetical protein
MNTGSVLVTATIPLILVGCFAPASHEAPSSTWHLRPPLDPSATLHVYVVESRPAVELEKQPSSDYLYSGALFATEGNARTVAAALGGLSMKFGGATRFQITSQPPSAGPAVVFALEHWYSRTLLKPEKAPILVDGEFSGALTLQRDGRVLASRQVKAQASALVDTYIVFEREKRETPRLLAKAMEQCANNAEQKGYAEVMNFFQQSWSALQAK